MASFTPEGVSVLPPPTRARVFDWAVVGTGCAVAVVALVTLLGDAGVARPELPLPFWACALAGLPLTTYACRHTLKLVGFGGAVQLSLDTGVLVFLASVGPPGAALAAWLAGVVLAELIAPNRLAIVRAFNVGLAALGGSGLVWALVVLGAPEPAIGAQDLLAVAVGTAIYTGADTVATAISVAWGERQSVREALTDESLLPALLTVFAIDCLGLLTALLWTRITWAVVLVVPSLVALAYAARVGTDANTARDRSEALFEAAAGCQRATTADGVVAAVTAAARKATAAPTARFSSAPPAHGEVGAAVPAGRRERWLVVSPRAAGNEYLPGDLEALGVLGALAGQAFARVEAEAALRRAATRDALTGLANRGAWDERLAAAVDQAAVAGRPTVLYVDLDGFKQVNDTFGHAAGDDLLRAVADRLLAAVRPTDTVARIGGDEFAVLLVDADDAEAGLVRGRVLDALRPPVVLDGHEVVPRASIGLGTWSEGLSAGDLQRRADRDMYAAKQTA